MARYGTFLSRSKSTRDGEVEVELLFRDGYTKNASEKSLKYADRLRMIITHYKSLKGHVIK